MIRGKDYAGNVVATFYGKYTVEDGPTFDHIPDRVKDLWQVDLLGAMGPVDFGAPRTYKVRQIDPAQPVRYFLEVAPGGSLPTGTYSTDDSLDEQIRGALTRPYEVATIRFRARDSDGTVGYSNWFRFGTGRPTPICNATAPELVPVVTGQANLVHIPAPNGRQGTLNYRLVSGALPKGLSLNAATGNMDGTALVSGERQTVTVVIDVINGEHVDSTTQCKYTVEVWPAGKALNDMTPAQDRHVRFGDAYAGTLGVVGGIPDYSVSFKSPAAWPEFSFASATVNAPSVTVKGIPSKLGVSAIPFTLTNGDGSSDSQYLTVTAHGELAVDDVPTVMVQRLAAPSTLAQVGYDHSTVIPDLRNNTIQPTFTLDQPGLLPDGVTFDPGFGQFKGQTAAQVGTYGPFTVTMSDFSGDKVTTNRFNVEVSEREPIKIASVAAPQFNALVASPQSFGPIVKVVEPALAAGFEIRYTLDGPALPAGLTFDTATATIAAEPDLAHDLVGKYGPYTITAVDSEGSSATSDPFAVEVVDIPQPSPLGTYPTITGNVTGDTSRGETATWVTAENFADHIDPKSLVGGRSALGFVSSDPARPAGLYFDAVNGALNGVPTEEFNGTANITFADGANRTGLLPVQIDIRPYPKVAMTADAFDLPRLAEAGKLKTKIAATTLTKFFGAPRWSWDPAVTPPAGLSVDPVNGWITGSVAASVGTQYDGLRLMATSTGGTGTALVSYTQPFSVRITEQSPLTLDYAPAEHVFYLEDKTLALKSQDVALPTAGGSYDAPLVYSLDLSNAPDLSGVSIDPATGVLKGAPTALGIWDVKVDVTDASGQTAASPASLRIKSTLSGSPTTTPGGSVHLTLRQSEPFSTAAIPVTNFVGSMIFSTNPALLDGGLSFSSTTGEFAAGSAFDFPYKKYVITVSGTDSHDRAMTPFLQHNFVIVPPLDADVSPSERALSSKQYSAVAGDPLDETFHMTVHNQMGNLTYDLQGTVPGTLVKAVYDENRNFVDYEYTLADGTQIKTTDRSAFPPDAILFDTLNPALKGIPSRAGKFVLKVVATDDHWKGYSATVPTQMSYNTAVSSDIVIDVAPADPFTQETSAASEDLHQYTSQPTVTSVTANAAYGLPVTWTPVAGTLPKGVSAVKGATALAYSGYPTVTGTYSDIRWAAVDAAGRQVETPAVSFNVGNRSGLALAASQNPAGLLVNAAATPITVTATNTPYGQTIPAASWSVSGVANVPPGMTYKIADGGVAFSGTPTTIGTYTGVTVSATDSLGAIASVAMTFKVILPTDAIVVNVTPVKTKVGYDFSMQATATNTYGTVRFDSYAIKGQYSSQLKLDKVTGLVTGAFSTVGDTTFDVFATDDTTRLTSQAVQVSVLPQLRVIVPQSVSIRQTQVLDQSTSMSYNAGLVTYEKGKGDWPLGISVNQQGHLVGEPLSPTGTYSGLTIVGTDTWYTSTGAKYDRQESNEFSIVVLKKPTVPSIANISDKAYTVGTAIPAITPVTTNGTPPDVYVLTGTLPHGLNFDTETGVISGTPQEPGVFPVSIGVRDINLEGNTTAVFKIRVAPTQAITVDPALALTKTVHTGNPFTLPVRFLNTVGTVTYSIPARTMAGTASISGTDLVATSSVDQSARTITIRATDEMGRTGQFNYTVGSVTLSAAFTSFEVNKGSAYTGSAPAVSNPLGAVTFSYDGLPADFIFDPATGAISTPQATMPKRYQVTAKVTSVDDGATYAEPIVVYVVSDDTKFAYWRLSATIGTTQPMWAIKEMNFLDVAGNSLSAGKQAAGALSYTVTGPAYANHPERMFDGSTATNAYWCLLATGCTASAKGQTWSFTVHFATPIAPTTITMLEATNGTDAYNYMLFRLSTAQRLERSKDGVTWEDASMTFVKGAIYQPTAGSAPTAVSTMTIND